MKVLFFSNKLNANAKRLLALIKEQVSPEHLFICRNRERLESNLKANALGLPVLIILAHDPDTLQSITAVRGLCRDLPVIMVLPDREWTTHFLGLQFTPRCISYLDSDFSDVGFELAKLMMRDARIKIFQYKDEYHQSQEGLELENFMGGKNE